jgi:hypothetical protein
MIQRYCWCYSSLVTFFLFFSSSALLTREREREREERDDEKKGELIGLAMATLRVIGGEDCTIIKYWLQIVSTKSWTLVQDDKTRMTVVVCISSSDEMRHVLKLLTQSPGKIPSRVEIIFIHCSKNLWDDASKSQASTHEVESEAMMLRYQNQELLSHFEHTKVLTASEYLQRRFSNNNNNNNNNNQHGPQKADNNHKDHLPPCHGP